MRAVEIEYVGFQSQDGGREYTLRVRHLTDGVLTFVRVIPDAAFVAGRARYQDGPEICFLSLQREIADPECQPAHRSTLGEGELLSYKEAHAPRPPKRKPLPPPDESTR